MILNRRTLPQGNHGRQPDGFGIISAIPNASEFDKLTDDESHVRYRVFGLSENGKGNSNCRILFAGHAILENRL